MDTHYTDVLKELKLRGVIAFAARCARRVFPVVVLANDAVQECDEAIAMAESFAAGEPGALLSVRRVAEAVRDDTPPPVRTGGSPRTPQHNHWYARHAAVELAHATVCAFTAVTRIPPSKSCCYEAVGWATTAVRYALQTTEPFPDRVRSEPVRIQEADWAREALRRDAQNLRKSHSGAVTDLGLAIDTSTRGPLGPLWLSNQVPTWYQYGLLKWRSPRGITVTTGRDFLDHSQESDSFPDLVCWYLDGPVEEDLEHLNRSLQQVQEISRSHGRLPPGLIVYAPGIAEEDRIQLVDLGAIVYGEPRYEWFKPYDDDSLRDMLRNRLEEAYEGWEQNDAGFWRYAGAKVQWRVRAAAPAPFIGQSS